MASLWGWLCVRQVCVAFNVLCDKQDKAINKFQSQFYLAVHQDLLSTYPRIVIKIILITISCYNSKCTYNLNLVNYMRLTVWHQLNSVQENQGEAEVLRGNANSIDPIYTTDCCHQHSYLLVLAMLWAARLKRQCQTFVLFISAPVLLCVQFIVL